MARARATHNAVASTAALEWETANFRPLAAFGGSWRHMYHGVRQTKAKNSVNGIATPKACRQESSPSVTRIRGASIEPSPSHTATYCANHLGLRRTGCIVSF